MKTNSSRLSFCLTLLAAAVFVASGQSQALGVTTSYNVAHNYSWVPTNPGATLQVSWSHFEHAWADDSLVGSTASVNPVPQANNFYNLGTDSLDSTGLPWNSGAPPGPVLIVEAIVNLTGVVPPVFGSSTVNAAIGGCNASATSFWAINAAGNGLSARNESYGLSSTGSSHANRAYAFSESKLTVNAPTQNAASGIMTWQPSFGVASQPTWSDVASGSAYAWDPIHVTMFDDAGVVALEDTPIHIEGELLKAETDLSNLGWENGRLYATDVLEGSIVATVYSEYVDPTQWGELEIRVHHGVVTTSRATGIFNTVDLPLPGSIGTFDVAGINELALNYSYPEELAPNMSLSFGGGGGGGCVPEPGTLALLVVGGVGLLAYVVGMRKRSK
jgi:hypothetical protein